MQTKSAEIKRLVVVRLDSGEDILQSICKAVEENNIQTGLILSGVGSVSRFRVHVVETTNLPPGNVYFEEEDAYDVLSITGAVLDGRVHAHITLSNSEKAVGGHLHEGCTVLTFGMVILAETPEIRLTDWDKMGEL